jgi:hypothetical protein
VVLVTHCLGASVLWAQRPARDSMPKAASLGRFTGTVVDAMTQRPIVGARIVSSLLPEPVRTDSLGRFAVRNIPSGLHRFVVVADRFPRATFALAFAPGEEMERTLELDSTTTGEPTPAVAIPEVRIEATAPPPPWLREFERRRGTGRGQYVTRSEIEVRGANRLSDVAQAMRGVTLDCGGGGGACVIRMSRAPLRCYPEYWVDGQPMNAMWAANIPIRDIEAMEVYVGPTDTPAEFAGRTAGCGTIVIWTSAGTRRRP